MQEMNKILALPSEEWSNFFKELSIEETKDLMESLKEIGE